MCAAFAEKHSRGTWATREPRSSDRDAAFIWILKGLNDALQVAESQRRCTPTLTAPPPPACLPLCPASLGDEQLLRVRSGSVNNAAGVAPGGVFLCVCAAPTHYESVSRCQGANLRLGVLPSAVQLRQAECSGERVVGEQEGGRGHV